MARHNVTITVPGLELGKKDVEFRIRTDSQALGRLKLSKGAIVWVPKNGHKGLKMPWTVFGQLMEQHGQRE